MSMKICNIFPYHKPVIVDYFSHNHLDVTGNTITSKEYN